MIRKILLTLVTAFAVMPLTAPTALAASAPTSAQLRTQAELMREGYAGLTTTPQLSERRAHGLSAGRNVAWSQFSYEAKLMREGYAGLTRTPEPTTLSSGRDIEWRQLGMGFGVGIVLALGLFLAVRFTRFRPLAH